MPTALPVSQASIAIRQATAADAAAVRALRLEALQLHPTSFGSDYERESPWTVADWEQRLARAYNAVFVAQDQAELVGMLGIYYSEYVKLRHNGGIWGVYVRPAWRGQGIAPRLLAASLDWARARQVELVRLAVVTTNTAALRAYLKAGFRVYGVDPRVIHYDGVYHDEVMLVRELWFRPDEDVSTRPSEEAAVSIRAYIVKAWVRQLLVELVSFLVALAVCLLLVYVLRVRSLLILNVVEVYGLRPYHEAALRKGVDPSIVYILQNAFAALVLLLLLPFVSLLDPARASEFPSGIRRFLIRQSNNESDLKLLGAFKGFRAIPGALLRSIYLYLDRIPILPSITTGLVLGILAGLTRAMMGSFLPLVILVAPHGILEIPTAALAWSLTRAGALMVHSNLERGETEQVFATLRAYAHSRTLKVGILIVVVALVIAGVIEGHVTPVLSVRFGYT